MRRRSPPSVALADQILAIVRDAAPLAVGTHDIGMKLGRWRYDLGPWCDHSDCTRPEHRRLGAWFDHHPSNVVRPLLLAFEREGLVERHRVPRTKGANPYGQDYWRYTGPT